MLDKNRTLRSKHRSRRGVSEIIASLIMIVIVVSVSAFIVSGAATSMASWGSNFSLGLSNSSDVLNEQFIVEFITFNTTGPTQGANIYVRNVGQLPLEIAAVYVTNDTGNSFAVSLQISSPKQLNTGSFQIIPVKFKPGVGYAYSFKLVSERGNSVVALAKT